MNEVTHQDICSLHEGGQCNCDWSAAELAAEQQDVADLITELDRNYPELYWHIAKGKITAGEPLYGAIITTVMGVEIGHGESDLSAQDALRIAIDAAMKEADQ